jgi:Ni/Co efflux regulator RcnB
VHSDVSALTKAKAYRKLVRAFSFGSCKSCESYSGLENNEETMRKFLSTLCAAAMTLTAVVTTAPAQAAPMPQPKFEGGLTDVEQVKSSRHSKSHYNNKKYYKNRGNSRHHSRHGYYRNGNNYYYNGHRGYRSYRHGYRNYNGWWFPAGAFIAGAVVGGAIANESAPVYSQPAGNAHVQWCYNRYRSYRAYDNTFQPYEGPRQLCYSPYD